MENNRMGGNPDTQLISSILSDVRQRRILSLVADQRSPLTERDLAVRLAALEEQKPPSLVSASERESRLLALHHQKLPKLTTAGLIKRTPAGITLVPWFPIDLENYGVSVPPADDPEDPAWDLLAAIVERPYRQHVLTLVEDAAAPIPLEALATELVDHDQIALAPAERDRDLFEARLHHLDLPKLASLGVLEYDYEERTVRPSQSLTPVQKG